MKIHMHSMVFAPSVGGVETVGQMLAEEWTRMGVEVRVTTETPGTDEGLTFPIIRRPSRRVLWELARWADLVFHNHPSTRVAWAPILCRKPWLATVHTWLPMYGKTEGVRRRIQAVIQRKLTSRCQLLAVSEAVAKHLPKESTRVLPNPCRFPWQDTNTEDTRDIDVLFIGRLVSDKGVDLVIDALDQLAREKIFLKTTIIGDGPLRSTLQDKVRSAGLADWIQFTGTLPGDALQKQLSAARFTVVPSRWEEPFGLVAIEALACGSVPIVAHSGGLPEAAGPHGIRFPSGDASALADILRQVAKRELEIPRGDRSKVQPWLERHDPETVARRYLDRFREAL